MGSDIAITVEVTISEELRHLWVATRGIVPEPQPVAAPEPVKAVTQSAVDWQDVILRRDGQRPLTFRGLPVVKRHCISAELDGVSEQTLTIYLTEDRAVIAALVFDPPQTARARPAHRCQPIQDQADFAAFVKGWHPELCLEAAYDPTPYQKAAADYPAAMSAFKTMAADCLCKGVLQA